MVVRNESPTELTILPTKLQDDVQALLEEAGLGESDIDEIMKLIEGAELNACERAYEQQQERLMEGGGPPSLLEQQQAAYKIKRGLR